VKTVLVVVEGQTEERFVKDVLARHFEPMDLFLRPTILVTRVVKDGANFKGGLQSFAQFRDHVHRVLHGSGPALVTTLVDYYALPSDFPGMDTRPLGSALQRVQHVEAAVRQAFPGHANFWPFIALHEFEALLFADNTTVPTMMSEPQMQANFIAITRHLAPEEINEQPATAPSKRLLAMFPGYRKTLHGPTAVERITLPVIRARCPHFAAWIAGLEAFAIG
jgi:hypothetical protein